ncbi:MAG: tripartite tricarboxylate transporter substrate binding protein, partial [Betaproteobacteria bacterium]
VACAAALTLAGGTATAQPYPNKPVRMVVAFPPGGTSDFVGRVVANKLSEYLGQPIVIDNKPGASGLIGTEAVKTAAPDGYTILLAPSDFTLIPSLQAKPPYDPAKDFTPVGMVVDYPHVLVANPNVAASNAKELIALAKAKPGQLNYASGGNGATNHVSGAMFNQAAGVDITHVPYKGNGPAIVDLLADRVQLLFTSTGPVEAHLKSGKLKAIAVTGKTRLASLPDVPTVAENAIPGYEFTLWYGIVAPAGTPKAVVDRLNADLRKTMASPEVKEKLAVIGGNLNVGSPDEMAALLRSEAVRWTKLAKDANIKLD